MKWLAVLAIPVLAACEGVTIVQPPGVVDTVVVQDTVSVVVTPPPADDPEDEEEEAGENEGGEEEASEEDDDGRRGRCGQAGGPSPCRRGKGKGKQW